MHAEYHQRLVAIQFEKVSFPSEKYMDGIVTNLSSSGYLASKKSMIGHLAQQQALHCKTWTVEVVTLGCTNKKFWNICSYECIDSIFFCVVCVCECIDSQLHAVFESLYS